MERSRARSFGPTHGSGNYLILNDDGSTRTDIDYVTIALESSETIDDVVVDNYKRRRDAGDVIINPVLNVKVRSGSRGYGHHQWLRFGGRRYIQTGSITDMMSQREPSKIMGFLPAPTPQYDIVASAKLQALGKIDRSPYSFAEDIAELRETLKFLRNPFQSLRDLSKRFDKDVRKLRGRKKYLNDAQAIADVWLQYRFAFSPLVRSANDLIEAFGDNVKLPERRFARAFEEFSSSDSDDQLKSSWLSIASTSVDSTYRAGIVYEVSNPLQGWRAKYGLRFKDIPETLWAIVPYSFMVDRITNLSASLRGLSSFLDPNVEILGGWESVKTTLNQTRAYQGHDSGIVQTVEVAIFDEQYQETDTYHREPWTPVISDFVPPLRTDNLANTATKFADLAALILQRLR